GVGYAAVALPPMTSGRCVISSKCVLRSPGLPWSRAGTPAKAASVNVREIAPLCPLCGLSAGSDIVEHCAQRTMTGRDAIHDQLRTRQGMSCPRIGSVRRLLLRLGHDGRVGLRDG